MEEYSHFTMNSVENSQFTMNRVEFFTGRQYPVDLNVLHTLGQLGVLAIIIISLLFCR